jgi:acetylglutamate/LysW-gamma-L-alpha-aminoadipate kinase
MQYVIKIGGSILMEDLSPLALDIKDLLDEGHRIIVIHGGAKLVTKLTEQVGKKVEFIESPSGMRSRYTDSDIIELFIMAVAGKANKALVQQFLRQNIPAVGLSGFDAGIIQAKRKKRLKIKKGNKILMIDGGYTGKIQGVDPKLLTILQDQGFLPVIATLAISEENQPLNIDGDEAACMVAQSMAADQFIILTDVPGVLDENGDLIPHINKSQLSQEIKRVTVGMKRKLHAINAALESNIPKVTIASGQVPKPLVTAISGENCTVIE